MTVGERIKRARKLKGLTQKQLGELSETSEITVRQYELGKRQPRLEQLRRIASALDVEWTDLVPEDQQGHTVIDHMKDKLEGLGGEKSFEKLSTDELIELLKARIKEEPDTIKKLNDGFSDLGQLDDDSLVKISEVDGIPQEFLLSSYGKKRIEEMRNLLATIDKDGFLEMLEYLRYISYRQKRTQPPQNTPTIPSEGTDTPSLESPLEGPQEGK